MLCEWSSFDTFAMSNRCRSSDRLDDWGPGGRRQYISHDSWGTSKHSSKPGRERRRSTHHGLQPSTPVAEWEAPTGLDSGDPRCLRQMARTAMEATASSSDCQFRRVRLQKSGSALAGSPASPSQRSGRQVHRVHRRRAAHGGPSHGRTHRIPCRQPAARRDRPGRRGREEARGSRYAGRRGVVSGDGWCPVSRCRGRRSGG